MERCIAGMTVKMKGSGKLLYAVNLVRPLQLTVMLQEHNTMFITTLGPLLDKLIPFTYFDVETFGKIKAKTQMLMEQCSVV